jgi:hypothetical protein
MMGMGMGVWTLEKDGGALLDLPAFVLGYVTCAVVAECSLHGDNIIQRFS